MNRNLHSPTKLTEFARDFDTEPDTFLMKFVNKINNAYNSGYNTVNVVPTTSSVLNVGFVPIKSNASPTDSSSSSASLSSEQLAQQPISESLNPAASLVVQSSDSLRYVEKEKAADSPESSRNVRTPTSVIQRIGNLMAVRNNVISFGFKTKQFL